MLELQVLQVYAEVYLKAYTRSGNMDIAEKVLRDFARIVRELGSLPVNKDGSNEGHGADFEFLRANPMKSIKRDGITCLECGQSFKLLPNRHLALHELAPREYKKKWGIPMGTALSSKALTARRKKIARESGSGELLAEWRRQNGKSKM